MAERVRTLGNEFGATTGRPRRCGWFDAVVVRYAARINGLTDLAVTKLDVLDTLDRDRASAPATSTTATCTTEFPGDITALDKVRAAVRVDRRLAAARRRTRASSTICQRGARVSRPHAGAVETPHHVRERRHAARSDHRAR